MAPSCMWRIARPGASSTVTCWQSGRPSLADDALIRLNKTPPAAPIIMRFEMAITPAEFRRLAYLLPGAQQVRLDEMSATCEQTDGRRWRITLSSPRLRRLASLNLPISDVEIEMAGYSALEIQHFLERFHLVFRRGGG
jgi:hypothetical protein